MRPDIELHIEELILHGFAPSERYLLAEAAGRELTRLFAERDAPAMLRQSGELELIGGVSFDLKPGAGAEAAGGQLARAIYERLNG